MADLGQPPTYGGRTYKESTGEQLSGTPPPSQEYTGRGKRVKIRTERGEEYVIDYSSSEAAKAGAPDTLRQAEMDIQAKSALDRKAYFRALGQMGTQDLEGGFPRLSPGEQERIDVYKAEFARERELRQAGKPWSE